MGRTVAVILVLTLAACGSAAVDPKAEIQTAIDDYLSARTDLALDNLTVSVDTIEIDQDTAQAGVTIAASNDPAAKMQMAYDLVKRSGRWRVKAPESAADPHGAAPPTAGGGVLPPRHPPTGSPPPGAPGTNLPPDHPPLEGGESAPDPHANIPM